jgi:hypothetical protein
MTRPQSPEVPGFARAEATASHVPALVRLRPQRVRGAAPVDLSVLIPPIGKLLRADAERKFQVGVEKGRRDAEDAEQAEIIKDALSKVGDEHEDIAGAFRALAESGVIPEAAQPDYQIGTMEQLGMQLARDVTRQLRTVDNMERWVGSGEDFDLEAELNGAYAQAFQESALEGSFFGSQAFASKQSAAVNRFVEEVTQARTARVQDQHRDGLATQIGEEIARLDIADLEDQPEIIGEINRVIQEHGHERGHTTSSLQSITLTAIIGRANTIAETSPSSALAFIDSVGAAQIGDTRIDHPGSPTGIRLNDLRRDLEERAEDKAQRDVSRRGSRIKGITDIATGMFWNAALTALDEGKLADGAIEDALVGILNADSRPEEIQDVLIEMEEDLGEDIQGHLKLAARDIQQRIRTDVVDPSLNRAEVTRFERMRIDGFDEDFIMAQARDALGVSLSVDAYRDLQNGSDRNAPVAKYKSMPGGLYDVWESSMSLGLIPSNVAPAERARLLQLHTTMHMEGHGHLLSAVDAAAEQGTQTSAFDKIVQSTEFRAYTRMWAEETSKASAAYHTAISDVQAAIDGYDFVEARRLLETSLGVLDPEITGKLGRELRASEEHVGRIVYSADITNGAERAINAHFRALGEEGLMTPEEVSDRILTTTSRYNETYGTEGTKLLQENLPAIERRGRLQAASDTAVDALLEPFRRETFGAPVEGREDFAQRSLLEAQAFEDAMDVHGSRAEPYGTYSEEAQTADIDQKLLNQIHSLGDVPWIQSERAHKRNLYQKWDNKIITSGKRVQSDAFVALYGMDHIPWDSAVAGEFVLKTQPHESDLRRKFNVTGKTAREEVRRRLKDRGVKVLGDVPGRLGHIDVELAVDLKKVPLSPFATRYFKDIADFDALPKDDVRAAFKNRFNIDVSDDDAFSRAYDRFREAQEAAINAAREAGRL